MRNAGAGGKWHVPSGCARYGTVPLSDPLSMAMVELLEEQHFAIDASSGGEGLRIVATHPDGRTVVAEGNQPYLVLCALAVKIRLARPGA